MWLQNMEYPKQEGPEAEDNSSVVSLHDEQDDTRVSAALQSPSKDLICCLPPHLSMHILGLLDQKSLNVCAAVSSYWAFLVKEVKRERASRGMVQDSIQHLQGLCPRGAITNYAKTVPVAIPQLNEDGDVIEKRGDNWRMEKKEEENNLQAAYCDLETETIQLEERNIFCNSYNIQVLMDQSDEHRVIHYNGGNLVAVGSADRKVRLLGMGGMKEVPPGTPGVKKVSPVFSGHAGSIRALILSEKKGFVLSASFDLSIRCWDIYSGACVKIFIGHFGTITCLDLHEEQFVSGAKDGMVKDKFVATELQQPLGSGTNFQLCQRLVIGLENTVWNLRRGKCLRTLRHGSAVWAVKMGSTHIVSGCEQGLVKVWSAATGTLLKTLEGHQGPVKCLSFDQWHLVTGSTDGCVLGWSMLGNLKRCLTAFRHPKEVLSVEFLYLRVISGCADGMIRVFNYLTGSCLKVLMANSHEDPVSSIYLAGNRMVINCPGSVLLLQFEEVSWNYTLAADREVLGRRKQENGSCQGTPLQLQAAPPCPLLSPLQHLALQMQSTQQLLRSCWAQGHPAPPWGAPQALCYEQLKSAVWQHKQRFLKIRKDLHRQAEVKKKLFSAGPAQPCASALEKSAGAGRGSAQLGRTRSLQSTAKRN